MEKYGRILGIPYDFRKPTLARFKERMWNPDDPRVFTPRVFGEGWTINLATLKKKNRAAFYIVVAWMAIAYIRSMRQIYLWVKRVASRSGD